MGICMTKLLMIQDTLMSQSTCVKMLQYPLIKLLVGIIQLMTDLKKLHNNTQKKRELVVFGLLALMSILGIFVYGERLIHDYGHIDVAGSLVGIVISVFSLIVYIWFLFKVYKR